MGVSRYPGPAVTGTGFGPAGPDFTRAGPDFTRSGRSLVWVIIVWVAIVCGDNCLSAIVWMTIVWVAIVFQPISGSQARSYKPCQHL